MKFPVRLPILALVFLAGWCCSAIAEEAVPMQSQTTPLASGESGKTTSSEFTIPGPLRPFLRMAGISRGVTPGEVIPLLSRNVYTQGFGISGHPTEFLILLTRYVDQARELANLAGPDGKIRVSNCEDVKPLLRILGYRSRPNCGQADTSVQTEDPERAFVTIDSGFPLSELEQTLQGGGPFEYAVSSTSVPLIFAESDWTTASKKESKEKNSKDLLDALLHDPALARLYWAVSKLDPETGAWLREAVGIRALLPHAAALDFYGGYFCIRGGHFVVPGGPAAEAAWEDLAGASPKKPTEFLGRMLAKDGGWLAAYFDVLARAGSSRQVYFTEGRRLRLFYNALRSPLTSVKATNGAFRPAPGLLLFVTCLRWDSSGQPLVPGGLAVWNEIVRQKVDSHVVREFGKHSHPFASPDQLAQAMFSLARADTDAGPLQIYLTLSEIQARRSPDHPLEAETVRLMARRFAELSDQYRLFSEFPELSDASIIHFLKTTEALDQAPSAARGNALGIFQANLGIWQIFARQGQIPKSHVDESWQRVIEPFSHVRSSAQAFDAGRVCLEVLFRATGKPAGSQDDIIDLLAGPQQTTAEGKAVHRELAGKIRSVLDGQRLVSLDTVLALGDGLRRKAKGTPAEEWLIRRAGEIREFQMPRPIFTNSERTEWAAGVYNNRHTDEEMKTDVGKVLKAPSASPATLEEATGRLASFLRDILVGLNYAYYEPPGAQALHNNPLLVRAHDFSGESIIGVKTLWQAPQVYGEGSPAGGGAHLIGSLADLPRVLAELEQDFIAPENVQALIWRELVPNLLTNAVVPRWWDVSPTELHAVALYQRSGEELLTASQSDDPMRSKVLSILSDRLTPRQMNQVEQALRTRNAADLLHKLMPADTFYLAVEFERTYPEQTGGLGPSTQELQGLAHRNPEQVSWRRLSQDFGVPHPVLAQTYARELLNIAPIPAFAGYASRLLAESWDSTNLYWARLADETGYPPVTLNRLVPQLTQHMVEKIFATELEDWPAVLRAMRETDEDFRHGKMTRAAVGEESRP